MRAYTLPGVSPLTSCWRNSDTPGLLGIDRGAVDLLAARDREDDRGLGGVAVRVEGDHARDAGEVLGRGDQVAELPRGRAARGGAGLGGGEAGEARGVLVVQLLHALEQHPGRVVRQAADGVGLL